jgi:hypothetical protein
MRRKLLPAAFAILISLFCAYTFAQYTGFDIEESKPPRLLPTTGPGDRAIINQLQQTNKLLEQNNQILMDQNRLLRELVVQNRGKSK